MSRNVIVSELLARGLLNQPAYKEAQARAVASSRPILKVLIEDRFVAEEDVYRVVAEASSMPFLDLDAITPDPTALARLSSDWSRRLHALPYGWDGSVLLVAVDDPTSLTLRDDLARLTGGVELRLQLAPPTALVTRIGQVYRSDSELDNLSEAIQTESLLDFLAGGEAPAGEEASTETDAPIVKYVNLMIAQAVADRASDVHIEPTETDVQVRYRIDGVLHKQMQSPRNILSGVVSRLKVMANMDIAERRVPQDGRMTVNVQGRKIDLRVTTLPTVWGEKVVLRILDNASAPLDLREIGFSETHVAKYEGQYKQPNGLILVTGPTGSGKSTTLYATLNAVKSPTINVITVEDPVEYRMSGISQMQIAPKAGLTFASALRSILRADPDVVLVGEIRDRETAQIAVEAALTGHLVLSSLHTNDAPSAITRLIEMGIEPFLVGSALSTVVAQRLVRRLCERCKRPYELTAEEAAANRLPLDPGVESVTVFRPEGCMTCARTGYRGRAAIHELLVADADIERLANDGAHGDVIREAAIVNGMAPMRADGWHKVLNGVTSVEEVLRVVG